MPGEQTAAVPNILHRLTEDLRTSHDSLLRLPAWFARWPTYVAWAASSLDSLAVSTGAQVKARERRAHYQAPCRAESFGISQLARDSRENGWDQCSMVGRPVPPSNEQ